MTFIECDGEKLPDYLFCYDDSQTTNIPPTASFDPASALDGQPFRSATSPSTDPDLKTLIITKDSFFSIDCSHAKYIAFIKRLKLCGFKIFMKAEIGEDNKFHEVDDNLTNIDHYINNLEFFDKERDDELIASEHFVEVDKSCLIEVDKYYEIEYALNENEYLDKHSMVYGFSRAFEKNHLEEFYLLPEDEEEAEKYLKEISNKEYSVYLLCFLLENDHSDGFIHTKHFIDENDKKKREISCVSYYIEKEVKDFVEGALKRFPLLVSETEYAEKIEHLLIKYDTVIWPNGNYPEPPHIPKLKTIGEDLLKEIGEVSNYIEYICDNENRNKHIIIMSNPDVAAGLLKKVISQMNRTSYTYPDSNKILEMILRYGNEENINSFLDTVKIDDSAKKEIKITLHSSATIDTWRNKIDLLKRFPKVFKNFYDKYNYVFTLIAHELLLSVIEVSKDIDKDFAIDFLRNNLDDYMTFDSLDVALLLNAVYDINGNESLDFVILELDKKNLINQSLLSCIYVNSHSPRKEKICEVGKSLKILQRINYNSSNTSNTSIVKSERLQLRNSASFSNNPIELFNFLGIETSIYVTPEAPSYIRSVKVMELISDTKDTKPSKSFFLLNKVKTEFSKTQRVTLLKVNKLVTETDIDLVLADIDVKNIVAIDIRKTSFELSSKLLERLPNLIYIEVDKDLNREIQAYSPDLTTRFIVNTKDALSKNIEIAQGSLPTDRLEENYGREVNYKMVEAGRILNGDIEAKDLNIRTGISIVNIEGNLERFLYIPELYEKQEIAILTAENIEEIESLEEDGFIYCQFSQIVQANCKSRLLSVDSEEEILGLLEHNENIKLHRGDDGFFYVENTSSEDIQISYVVKSQNPKQKSGAISKIIETSSNPFYQTIKEYLDNSKLELESVPSSKDKKIKDWLKELFDSGNGRCELRTAALFSKMSNLGFKDIVRIVDINNNHSIVEIKYGESWFKVDLGGENAKKTKAKKSEKYQSAPPKAVFDTVSQDIPPAISDESRESPVLSAHSDLEIDPVHSLLSTSGPLNSLSLCEEAHSALEIAPTPSLSSSDEKIISDKQKKLLEERIAQIRSFKITSSIEEISTLENNSLILTDNIEEHANFIINQSTILNRKFFYLNDSKQIRMGKKSMFIDDESGVPHISPICQLEKFINYCNLHPEEYPRALLIINWNNFTPNQALRVNTLLDESQSIAGIEFKQQLDIIGLIDNKPKDVSFLTRHQNKFKSFILSTNLRTKKIFDGDGTSLIQDDIIIDLKGFPDWKKYLFGPINLINNELVWNKSEFSEKLLDGQLKFNLKNISIDAQAELSAMVKQANACGFIEYHGYEFPLSSTLEVNFNEKEFDFDEINTSTHKSVKANFDQNTGAIIINSFLFDILLQDKEIKDGKYIETQGLIKRNADSTLKIYATSKLSKSQWYCLFNQAQQYNVSLEIFHNKDIDIPVHIENIVDLLGSATLDSIEEDEGEGEERKSDADIAKTSIDLIELEVREYPKIFITNNANDIVDLYSKEDKKFAIIDIADFTYQDLVSEITFESAEDRFENFQSHLSELITRLKSREQIVLKGNFSLEMIRLIEPILAAMPPEFNEIGKNLTVIIEDKFINPETTKTYKPLSWLGNRYKIASREIIERELGEEELIEDDSLVAEGDDTLETPAEKSKKPVIEEDPDKSLEDSKYKSPLFIIKRKLKFKKFLEKSSMLQLIGHSGVGKSRLLKIFEEEETFKFEVYRELNNLDKWANDNSTKTKILFIDESNIEDFDLTMFEPLLKGRNKRILYKGKFYDLDDHHKVVFAGNPVEYGGGRKVQKLFSNHEISEFHLKDFPACYIYENILKAAIYDKLSPELKELVGEDRFKDLCESHIDKYYEENTKSPESLTVRELQENLLREIVQIYHRNQEIETHRPLSGKNYVSTETTYDLEQEIKQSILTRNLQRSGKLPNEAVGINGVFLQGQSGFGKSAMIEEILTSQRIHITHDKDCPSIFNAGAGHVIRPIICYKIDASQTKKSKEEMLIKAFNEGNIVWIDEINSCINDGLEKTLNSLLTGLHPKTGEKSENPGFMMLASSNSVGMTGRSKISPALRHRLSCPKVNRLSDFTVEDLQIMINSWDATLDPETNLSLARNFKDLVQEEGINFRTMKMITKDPELIKSYKEILQVIPSPIVETVVGEKTSETLPAKTILE